MDNRAITRVIEILETDDEFFVPLKKLWQILQKEGLVDDDLEGFHNALQADDRFEFTSGVSHRERFEIAGGQEYAEEMEQEMEALGFYGGPRVKLVSRALSVEDVFAAMARNLIRMNEALQGAWETRPGDDPELEGQLLDILAAGQKLEREISALIEQERQDSQAEDPTA
jgi:signal transduction histidine kinase